MIKHTEDLGWGSSLTSQHVSRGITASSLAWREARSDNEDTVRSVRRIRSLIHKSVLWLPLSQLTAHEVMTIIFACSFADTTMNTSLSKISETAVISLKTTRKREGLHNINTMGERETEWDHNAPSEKLRLESMRVSPDISSSTM